MAKHFQCNECGEIYDRFRDAAQCHFGIGGVTDLNEDFENDLPEDTVMNNRAAMGDEDAMQWVYRNLK